MSAPISTHPVNQIPNFTSSTPPSSVWDRISTWASEHKAVVYTIAGVAVVVTGAGVAYYLTESVGGMINVSRWNVRMANAMRDRAAPQVLGIHLRSQAKRKRNG